MSVLSVGVGAVDMVAVRPTAAILFQGQKGKGDSVQIYAFCWTIGLDSLPLQSIVATSAFVDDNFNFKPKRKDRKKVETF